MRPALEAVVDKYGKIKVLEKVQLPHGARLLVTVLGDAPIQHLTESLLLSESALGRDWNRKEEDKAWAHLQ